MTGRLTRAAAARELETLLADADRVRDVTMDGIRSLGARHGIDLGVHMRTLRRNLYRRFLEHCLLDYTLDDVEVEDLGHLRRLLHLDDSEVADAQDQVARKVYGAAVEEALEDHRLDEDEVRFLKRLREDLDLADFHANRMLEEERRRSQQRLLSQASVRPSLLTADGPVVELEGVSPRGVQGAIQAAVDEAAESLPKLAWAELSDVRVEIRAGLVKNWVVRLRFGIQPTGHEGSDGQSPRTRD